MTDRPLPAQGFFPIFYWPNVPYLKIFRRPDFVILAEGSVVVLELKGKTIPSQADIDQVASYARDLRAYHRECENREVLPVVVPTRSNDIIDQVDGVYVSSPDKLDELIAHEDIISTSEHSDTHAKRQHQASALCSQHAH